MASAAPFLAENLYQRLKTDDMPESIHLLEFSKPNEELINKELEQRMALAQTIVFLARSLREKSKLRVRQPLKRILIPVSSPQERRDIQYFEDIIKEELNIKAIEFVTDDSDIVKRSAKPNFKVIGKKFGKLTKAVAPIIKELKEKDIKKIEKEGSLQFDVQGDKVDITLEDIELVSEDIEGWLVASEDHITVALDTQLDQNLIDEGLAREFVNRVQNHRKDSGFEVIDRISIIFDAPEAMVNAVEKLKDYISNETLSESIEHKPNVEGAEFDIDNIILTLNIEKVQ
jgi:isoleucyl-tRNA synthetase